MIRIEVEALIVAAKAEQRAIHHKADVEDRPFTHEENIRLSELKITIESYQRRLSGQ